MYQVRYTYKIVYAFIYCNSMNSRTNQSHAPANYKLHTQRHCIRTRTFNSGAAKIMESDHNLSQDTT